MVEEGHIYDRIHGIARQAGDRIALSYHDGSGWCDWSYAELLARSSDVAAELVSLGVAPGSAIGLIAHRCPETIAAMLGILKVGASYVPVDPLQPLERVKTLFEAAGVELVIKTDSRHRVSQSVWIGDVDGREAAKASAPSGTADDVERCPEDIAYVMFTSGSTGRPKGVMVPHRAITRLVVGQDYLRFDNTRVFLHAASMSFDASTLEIWGALLHGGRCVLYPSRQLPTSEGLSEVIKATGVTTAWLSASLFNAIVSHGVQCLHGLEELIIGGEPLSVPHVHKALAELNGTQLVNGYGPTENTTFSTCYRIPKDLPRDAVSVPIGRPIRGTHVMVVDDALQPVAAGEKGELLTMGDGLAVGYLGQPGLTADQFVDVKGGDGTVHRAYRTGDWVVERPDGTLEFLGRRDEQVQIDGSRVEPREVETVIVGLPEVSECRVVTFSGPLGQVRLAAYVVLCEGRSVESLGQSVAAVLPAYMVPHHFVSLPSLPLNANGKLALDALPSPLPSGRVSGTSEAESPYLALAEQAWLEVLGCLPESAEVNFFDAGGRSLEAVMLHDLLERRLGVTLAPTFAFEFSTVRRQADELEALLEARDVVPPGFSGGLGSVGKQ